MKKVTALLTIAAIGLSASAFAGVKLYNNSGSDVYVMSKDGDYSQSVANGGVIWADGKNPGDIYICDDQDDCQPNDQGERAYEYHLYGLASGYCFAMDDSVKFSWKEINGKWNNFDSGCNNDSAQLTDDGFSSGGASTASYSFTGNDIHKLP